VSPLVKTIGLGIDVACAVTKLLERFDLDLSSKIVMLRYDVDADTLYIFSEKSSTVRTY